MTGNSISYIDLITGYEFPPAQFTLDDAAVEAYLAATGESNTFYNEMNAVPPTAAVAFAMTALARGITFPDGAIHVSQGMEFMDIVHPGESITSKSKITRNQKRGQLHLLSISLQLFNSENKLVAAGSTEFILSQSNPAGK